MIEMSKIRENKRANQLRQLSIKEPYVNVK
jgi:hypothetical protein